MSERRWSDGDYVVAIAQATWMACGGWQMRIAKVAVVPGEAQTDQRI
jgi:hypothetical protein